jgi:hypothetical protein
VPQGRPDDEILIDENIRVTVSFGSREVALMLPWNGRQSSSASVTVDLAVFLGKMDVGYIVVRFMNN